MSDSDANEVEQARERVLGEGDRDVWVVERNPGSGWRVSAVLPSYEAAEAYEKDLRKFLNHYPDEFPEKFKCDYRTRHGGRKSPTKMWESYPPEESA